MYKQIKFGSQLWNMKKSVLTLKNVIWNRDSDQTNVGNDIVFSFQFCTDPTINIFQKRFEVMSAFKEKFFLNIIHKDILWHLWFSRNRNYMMNKGQFEH